MNDLLQVKHLNKHYPEFALKDISFDVKPGRIMGLIGKNGAGKSTTLKSILNMVQPESGTVAMLGKDFYEHEKECKQNIGVVFGGIDFYPLKKLSAITDVTRRFYRKWDQQLYKDYLRQFSLDESKQFRSLSNGMKVKYLLALALSHHAVLYILDEPTSGLDPVSRDEILHIFTRIVKDGKRSVLFSTHITSDLDRCADDITYTVSQLKTMISEQTELIKSLRLIIDEKTSHEKALQEQVDYLTKKLFGSSSEKRSDDIPGQQNLFDEAEMEQDSSLLEEETVIREHPRKKKATHEELFKGLKVEKVVIPLPEEDQICPVCGTQMVLIGEEYVRRELEFIPATCKVIEYYSQSYGCPSCKDGLGDTEKPVIVKSQVPAALVGKGPASASTIAWTMYQKYANGLPLYRQEKDWKQYGAQISRTTLANWIIYCSQNYFQPMYDYFHRELLKRSFAMADETRVQVLNEEGRRAQTQSFMWLFRSGEDGLPSIILYGYSPTRSGSHARAFLEGYSGYLETDGYQGYNNLPGIRRCSCWAHIRRYFIDAVPKGKQYDYSQPAVQGVQYCSRLFAIEDSINKKYPGDYEKRKQLRLEKEKPVLEAFWSWLDQQKPVRNTRMDKAVNYVLNRRDTAETYLEDGRCSFTNNLSENAIRPFAVGRKNWLFSNSVDGANASAVVYTMVEMAKAYDLNIYGYLKFLLEHRPSKDMTDEQLAELAPWNEKLQSIKNRM